jgi:hypothetical protein
LIDKNCDWKKAPQMGRTIIKPVKALISGDLEKQVQERIQGDSSDIKIHFYATGFNTGKQPFMCHVLFGSGSYVNVVAQWTGEKWWNLEVMQIFGAYHCAESFIDMYVCSFLCSLSQF